MRCAMAMALLVGALGTASPLWAASIEPVSAVQEQIARAAAANSEDELATIVEELKASSAPGYGDLIPQLVYALMNAKDSRDALLPSVLLRRLGISHEQLRVALQPYRSTAEPRLQTAIDNLLRELGPTEN